MKPNIVCLLLMCAWLTSCSDYTSIPPSVYGQNRNLIEKPTYQGRDTSMIYISGAFSNLNLQVYDGDGNGTGLSSVGEAGNIEAGLVEVSYARSHKSISYGFGLMGALGNYSGEFIYEDSIARPTPTAGLGAKANFSIDLNRGPYTGRMMQIQVAVAREFGEYSRQRFDVQPDQLNLYVINYSENYVVDLSISHFSGYSFEGFRLGVGAGLNFCLPGSLGEGAPSLSLIAKMIMGFKNFDLCYLYSYDESLPVGNTQMVGLGYRFGLKK